MYELRKCQFHGDDVTSYQLTEDVNHDVIGLYDADGWVEDFHTKHLDGLVASLAILNDGNMSIEDYRYNYDGGRY